MVLVVAQPDAAQRAVAPGRLGRSQVLVKSGVTEGPGPVHAMAEVGVEAEVLDRLAEHGLKGEQVPGVRPARLAGFPALHHADAAAVGVAEVAEPEPGLAYQARKLFLAQGRPDTRLAERYVSHDVNSRRFD